MANYLTSRNLLFFPTTLLLSSLKLRLENNDQNIYRDRIFRARRKEKDEQKYREQDFPQWNGSANWVNQRQQEEEEEEEEERTRGSDEIAVEYTSSRVARAGIRIESGSTTWCPVFHRLVGCAPGGRGGWRISRGLHSPPFSYPHHVLRLPLTFTNRCVRLFRFSLSLFFHVPRSSAAERELAARTGKRGKKGSKGVEVIARETWLSKVGTQCLVPAQPPFSKIGRSWKTCVVSRRGQR